MTTETKPLGVVEIPLDQIRPNPYQPRTRLEVPEAELEWLAASLRTYGLIQTPVGRFVGAEGKNTAEACAAGHYEVADGWRRLCAFKWNRDHGFRGFDTIRFDIRLLSDQSMADLIIEANQVRKDLNPIETAGLFQRYLADFKQTQAELAKSHGISQGELANTIRLLELPAAVQDMIVAGDITPAHGRALLQLRHEPCFDADALFLADKARVNGITVSLLDIEVKALLNSRRPKMEMPEEPIDKPLPVEVYSKFESQLTPGEDQRECGQPVEELPVVEETEEESEQPEVKATVRPEPVEGQKPAAAKSVHKEPLPVAKPAAKPVTPPAPVLPRPTPVATTPTAPAAPASWKRKMIIEETSDGVMISVMMAGKFPVFRKFSDTLATIMFSNTASTVLDDATAAWLAKEATT